MKVIIGSDHNGYNYKQKLITFLKSMQIEVIDEGTNSEDSTDYPIFAQKVCEKVLYNPNYVGILLCGTGIGMSIAANKFKNIRCAKIDNENEARYAKIHNNANVIAISSKKNYDLVEKMVYIFLKTPFSFEERHIRRIKEIETFM